MQNNFKEALSNAVFLTISKASEILGVDSYVIGGYVRDYFLKRNQQVKDIDIVVVGDGIQLAKKVSELLPEKPKVSIFKNFGTAMVKTNHIILEFVGARKESYTHNSRKPKVESGSLQEDQNRRDFTINTLALSLNKKKFGYLLDPFEGLADLHKRMIRTPLEPKITYSDDPLRMMRAIRFASQLDFRIEINSLNAIRSCAKRLTIISNERITEELHKIIGSVKPSIGFKHLLNTNLLPLILPELTALQGVEEKEGQKHKDNFWHTLEVVDNIAKKTDNLWLRWAALLHDIGKAPTKKFNPKVGWTFHGHEFIGAKMVYKLFKRLCLPLNDKMKYVQKLVFMSSRPIILSEDFITDSAVRRLIFDAGDCVEDLLTLCEADITTKNLNKYRKYKNNFKIVRQKIVEVEERDNIRKFQPPISGKEIMDTFNLRPSREIGIIKEAIKEAILEGDISNEYEAAYNYMLKKGSAIGLEPVKKPNRNTVL